jgi:hypothetical protein
MSLLKKMGYELSRSRKIDVSIEKTLRSVKSGYRVVPSIEIKTWKAYFIVAFVAGFSAAMIWSAYMSFYPVSEASDAKVTLSASSAVASHKSGEEFPVQILLNTAGKNIVAVQAIFYYDKNSLELLSLDTSDSSFNYEVKKTIDTGAGQGFVALGKPTPGVNSASAKVATATFRAIADVSEPTAQLKFDSLAAVSDSAAILDDGQGTNVLEKLAYSYSTVNSNPAPANFQISSIVSLADMIVKLDWTEGSLTGKSYIIERKTAKTGYAVVGTTENSVKTYTDHGLKPSTAYVWRICQQNDNGEKACTAEKSLRTLKKKKIIKPRLSVVNENGKMRINWSPAYVSEFRLTLQKKVGKQKAFKSFTVVSPDLTTYLDENVVAGTRYIYRLVVSLKGKSTTYSNNIKIVSQAVSQATPQTIIPQTVPQDTVQDTPEVVPQTLPQADDSQKELQSTTPIIPEAAPQTDSQITSP